MVFIWLCYVLFLGIPSILVLALWPTGKEDGVIPPTAIVLRGGEAQRRDRISLDYMGDKWEWYYWPTDYPEEGKVGPFDSYIDAIRDAGASGNFTAEYLYIDCPSLFDQLIELHTGRRSVRSEREQGRLTKEKL